MKPYETASVRERARACPVLRYGGEGALNRGESVTPSVETLERP